MIKENILTRLEGRVVMDVDWQSTGVTSQFLDNADTYHERYYNNDYWKFLVERSLELACIDRRSALSILDIGSGSGNTVFATLEIMPNAVVVANDISPQLLNILVGIQDKIPEAAGRVQAYCFDLHKDFFSDNSFDLIIGGAILHHMLDPEAAIRNAARWIRPGGKIILIEPMEVGAHIMTAIYLTLIAELEPMSGIDSRLIGIFKALCHDYEARFGIPRIKPWTKNLDDKWMFHRSYLENMARNIGLKLDVIAPTTTDLSDYFKNTVLGALRAAGLPDVEIPAVLLDVVNVFDLGISQKLKEKLTLESIVILSK